MVLARRTAVATAAMALLAVPLGLPKFYLMLAIEILIMGLFAIAFNLLLGYGGMVSFGHAAFYGVGAYTCGLLLKKADAPFAVSFLAAPVVAAAVALLFGLLCIRLTRIYFSMLTLAFSQIVWAIAFKWYSLTGGDNGLIGIPVPRALADPRALYLFTVAIVVLVGGLLWRLVNAPFGRTLLGGPYVFLGPALGAAILIALNSVVTSFTEYWPVVLGAVLLVLIYVFPGGVTRLFLVGPTAPARAPGEPR